LKSEKSQHFVQVWLKNSIRDKDFLAARHIVACTTETALLRFCFLRPTALRCLAGTDFNDVCKIIDVNKALEDAEKAPKMQTSIHFHPPVRAPPEEA
jgi:hypothetical protein